MRRLALTAVLAASLSLAGCAALEGVFAPSTNPDGTPGKSKAQEVAEAAAPFLPSPFGDLAKIVSGLLTGAGAAHVYHKRKKKPAADAKPSA